MVGDFKTRFAENIQKVGELLESNGYRVAFYNAAFADAYGYKASSHAPNIDEALEEAFERLEDRDVFFARVYGKELEKAYNGEMGAETLVYRLVHGGIEIEESFVNLSEDDEEESEEAIFPEFGIVINYMPSYPEGRWAIRSTASEVSDSDAAERKIQEIREVLEQKGIDVETSQPIN